MSEVATEEDVDLFLELEHGHELPCEHSQHGTLPIAHDEGMGVWYKVSDMCPGCFYKSGVILVCERFYEICHWDVAIMRCGDCGYFGNVDEFNIKWVKK